VIERLKEGDNYHIYLNYLEMLGILNINLLTDGDTREDFPILAETSEEKTSEAVTEIVQTEKKVEDKQVINDIQPKTGDESPVLLMVVMLIVSAAAMLAFMRIKIGQSE
jgi:LPXTG-motif cell wall-anchored protein